MYIHTSTPTTSLILHIPVVSVTADAAVERADAFFPFPSVFLVVTSAGDLYRHACYFDHVGHVGHFNTLF